MSCQEHGYSHFTLRFRKRIKFYDSSKIGGPCHVNAPASIIIGQGLCSPHGITTEYWYIPYDYYALIQLHAPVDASCAQAADLTTESVPVGRQVRKAKAPELLNWAIISFRKGHSYTE